MAFDLDLHADVEPILQEFGEFFKAVRDSPNIHNEAVHVCAPKGHAWCRGHGRSPCSEPARRRKSARRRESDRKARGNMYASTRKGEG